MNDFFDRAMQIAPGVQWGDALTAVLAGVATFLLLQAGTRMLTRRLQTMAGSTRTQLDDGLAQVLSHTSTPLLLLVAVLVGVGLLPLDERWHERVSQLWFAVVAIQVGLWGQHAVSLMLRGYHRRHGGDAPISASATMLGWGLRGALWLVVVLAVLANLGINITAFIASLGIGGIAVALAVQNILGDLFASLAIAVDKPFEVGDVINVGGVTGVVEKVGLKTTRIRALGGEQVVMSNSELLKQTVANFKRLRARRVVFGFGLTYDATADQVAEVVEVVRGLVQADERLEFLRAHFKGFGESSLDFEVVYRVKDDSYDVYMDCQQALNLGLMRAFAERGLQFAFPTRTLNIVTPGAPAGTGPLTPTGPRADGGVSQVAGSGTGSAAPSGTGGVPAATAAALAAAQGGASGETDSL